MKAIAALLPGEGRRGKWRGLYRVPGDEKKAGQGQGPLTVPKKREKEEKRLNASMYIKRGEATGSLLFFCERGKKKKSKTRITPAFESSPIQRKEGGIPPHLDLLVEVSRRGGEGEKEGQPSTVRNTPQEGKKKKPHLLRSTCGWKK